MPHHYAVYDEMNRSPSFAEAIARARAESAHGLAMQVLEIVDAAGPGDNPQLIKNRCDQRRWLAGKYNALYSDRVAVTDSDGGSIAMRLAKMSDAERAAWAAGVAAQARALPEAPQLTMRIADALQVTRVTRLPRARVRANASEFGGKRREPM